MSSWSWSCFLGLSNVTYCIWVAPPWEWCSFSGQLAHSWMHIASSASVNLMFSISLSQLSHFLPNPLCEVLSISPVGADPSAHDDLKCNGCNGAMVSWLWQWGDVTELLGQPCGCRWYGWSHWSLVTTSVSMTAGLLLIYLYPSFAITSCLSQHLSLVPWLYSTAELGGIWKWPASSSLVLWLGSQCKS